MQQDSNTTLQRLLITLFFVFNEAMLLKVFHRTSSLENLEWTRNSNFPSHILLDGKTKYLSFSFRKKFASFSLSSQPSFHFNSLIFREFRFFNFFTHRTFSASQRVFVQLRWVLNWFFFHVTCSYAERSVTIRKAMIFSANTLISLNEIQNFHITDECFFPVTFLFHAAQVLDEKNHFEQLFSTFQFSSCFNFLFSFSYQYLFS